ncbi:hypothetical protein, partial [Neorhizobium sp. R1-B]
AVFQAVPETRRVPEFRSWQSLLFPITIDVWALPAETRTVGASIGERRGVTKRKQQVHNGALVLEEFEPSFPTQDEK